MGVNAGPNASGVTAIASASNGAATDLDPLPAFEVIYAEHFAFVWRVLRGFGVATSSVDDALQDVFIAAYRRLPDFRRESSLRTWICAIAYRVALNYRRSQKRTGSLAPLDPEQPSNAIDPALTLENRRQLQRVDAFLNELDDGKRGVFLLTFVEGMTAPEIAEALTIPMNTVYSRLHHARAAFGSFLAREGVPE